MRPMLKWILQLLNKWLHRFCVFYNGTLIFILLFVLQHVIVMSTTLLACYVTMESVCVHWASMDHSAMNAMMVGIILLAVAVSLATVSSWEVNQTFVTNLPVYVTALTEPSVIFVMTVLLVPS